MSRGLRRSDLCRRFSRRGCRTGIDTAGIEPERWVLISHERRVGEHAEAPPVHAYDEVEQALRVIVLHGCDHDGDEGQQADEASTSREAPATGPAEAPPAGEDADDQVLRDGEQP